MRDFLPAVYPTDQTSFNNQDLGAQNWQNVVPQLLPNNKIGFSTRPEFVIDSFTANSADDRGRGVFIFKGYGDITLDQDTYHYSGGSQDLTVTSSPGYAGNTGFNEEYLGSFVSHNISGSENLVIVNAGHTSTNASAKHGNVWYAADPTSAPASVSDADMPGNNGVSLVRGGASLDGYFIVADINGKVHHSDLNDITAWTAANFITAERMPDTTVYCGRHHDSIVVFGTKSIEFFYNAGNATGSTLSRRTDIFHSIGCYFPNSVAEVGDVIYFVGTDHAGWSKIYKLDQYQLTAISQPAIEAQINGGNIVVSPDLTSLDNLHHEVYLTPITIQNNHGLVITSGHTTLFTHYYDFLTGIWVNWALNSTLTYAGGLQTGSTTASFPIVSFYRGSGANASARIQLCNGTVCDFAVDDNDAFSDLGTSNAVTPYVGFPMWDGGTDAKKRVNWVRPITMSRATTNVSSDPLLVTLKWSDTHIAKSFGPTSIASGYNTGRSMDFNVRGNKVAPGGITRQRKYVVVWDTGHGRVADLIGLEIDYDVVE